MPIPLPGSSLRAGIIGGGFMGGVHAHAVRASGAELRYVVASNSESTQHAATAFGATHAANSAEELIEAADVDVVHICVPNALHGRFARAALGAGKHVICEKPLATDVDAAADLLARSRDGDSVTAVPFVYRYYPTVREARARIADGQAGDLHLIHGSYLQDWMTGAQHGNWRLDPDRGGVSKTFADIGVHWCDLLEFTTGHRITRLCARTLSAPSNGSAAEDGATVLFETDRGAAGSLVVSQVSMGRKNQLWFSVDGERAAYVFDQERPDTLWVGGTENRLVPRGESGQTTEASRLSALPAGHPQGYQDCFNSFVADTYATIRGEHRDGIPTFADGARAAAITEAVMRSAAEETWVKVSEEGLA